MTCSLLNRRECFRIQVCTFALLDGSELKQSNFVQYFEIDTFVSKRTLIIGEQFCNQRNGRIFGKSFRLQFLDHLGCCSHCGNRTTFGRLVKQSVGLLKCGPLASGALFANSPL